MDKKEALVYAIMTIFVVLLLGRLLDLPVSLMIVAGRSMEPTLNIGDIVVGINESPDIGDMVVYCVNGNPLYCVVHRLVGYDANGEPIIKGDANPAPDPPFEKEIKYVVIATIPREVWVVPLLLFLLPHSVKKGIARIKEGNNYIPLFRTVLSIVVTWYISLVIIGLAVPKQIMTASDVIKLPELHYITHNFVDNYTKLELLLDPEKIKIASVEECEINVGENTIPVDAHISNNSIIINTPLKVWHEVYNLSSTSTITMKVMCKTTLDKGELNLSVPIRFNWEPLTIDGGVNGFEIVNNNPLPIEVNYTHRCINTVNGFGQLVSEESSTLSIGKLDSYVIPYNNECDSEYLIIEYRFLDQVMTIATKKPS